MLGAARRPASGRSVGTFSALALVLMALVRIFAWVMGDYAYLGDALRGEAVIFLLLALAFVWLRPPPLPEVAAGPTLGGWVRAGMAGDARDRGAARTGDLPATDRHRSTR